MKKIVVYIHGKGGTADEAEHYKSLFPKCDVVGLNYQAQTPWEAKQEISLLFHKVCHPYKSVILIANSIGAYFAMNSLQNEKIEHVFFISPIVNMEKLIGDMMLWTGISEQELQEKKIIETAFGETLSWEYLCYVRNNPITWNMHIDILYGEKDHLTSHDTIFEFAKKHGASLTVIPNGEHWFHTDEQMSFLNLWLKSLI